MADISTTRIMQISPQLSADGDARKLKTVADPLFLYKLNIFWRRSACRRLNGYTGQAGHQGTPTQHAAFFARMKRETEDCDDLHFSRGSLRSCHFVGDIEIRCLFIILVGFASSSLTQLSAGEGPPRSAALSAIFGDNVLADNVMAVRREASQKSDEERFQLLLRWVMPSDTYPDLRLNLRLTAINPAPILVEPYEADDARMKNAKRGGQPRCDVGGHMVGPALDLIQLAKQTDRLAELAKLLDTYSPSEEFHQRCKLSMLAVISMAAGKEDVAAAAADELHARYSKQAFQELNSRWPELFFIAGSFEYGMLANECHEFLIAILDNQVRKGTTIGPYEWSLLIENLAGISEYRIKHPEFDTTLNTGLAMHQWQAVSGVEGWSQAVGAPIAHWARHGEEIQKIASHRDEYLQLGIPLRGNFVFEVDCSGFGYKDCHPMVAGTWLEPRANHEEIAVGNLTRQTSVITLKPHLSEVGDWLRYRVEMKDGSIRRLINGREIQREALPKNFVPWVAIRSPYYGRGIVRDARITGDAVVLDQVDLSDLPIDSQTGLMDGWVPWFPQSGPAIETSWRIESDETSTAVFVGARLPNLGGSGAERLLRYSWPLMYASEWSYEFYNREGESFVHPAIGKRAFILQPNAISTHWVTDGNCDISGLSPLNATVHSTAPLPLRANDWNRISMSIKGDDVAIRLNEQLVLEEKLHISNDRCIGLFYYCDQTEARVRNIHLRGDWPKTLPSLDDQEFVWFETRQLDRERDLLADRFSIEFGKPTQAMYDAAFRKYQTSAKAPAEVDLTEDGLRMTLECPAGQRSYSHVFAALRVHGDFDVTAQFENLAIGIDDTAEAKISLQAILPVADGTVGCFVDRGLVQHSGKQPRQLHEACFLDTTARRQGIRWPAVQSDACESGRLRLLRRGTTVTFLIAESDSDRFRVIYTEEVSDQPLAMEQLQLQVGSFSYGKKGTKLVVLWKSFDVRADRIERLFGEALLRSEND